MKKWNILGTAMLPDVKKSCNMKNIIDENKIFFQNVENRWLKLHIWCCNASDVFKFKIMSFKKNYESKFN